MKKLFKIVLVVIVLLVIAAAILRYGSQAEPFPEGSHSAAMLEPGPYRVVVEKQTFIDSSRPTNPNGDYKGETSRTLEAKIWHPAKNDSGPFPLVVYSHGFSSTLDGGAYIAEQLASLGYVVVAANYPLTNFAAPGGPDPRDVVNQPGDVSYLIDRLIEQSNTSGHQLSGMVDESRVGVTGISLGGMTTALVSYHPEKRDPRIGAALSIAGPTEVFTSTFFTHAQLPFLMLAGDIDALVPYPTNAAPVMDKIPLSQLVTVSGGSHTGFAGTAAPMRWLSNPDWLGCYMIKQNIEDSSEEPWHELLGTQAQGINYGYSSELCQVDPLPEAINVLRQHMITLVVVRNFFQSVFATEESDRAAAQEYLSHTLADELSEVSYQRASKGVL